LEAIEQLIQQTYAVSISGDVANKEALLPELVLEQMDEEQIWQQLEDPLLHCRDNKAPLRYIYVCDVYFVYSLRLCEFKGVANSTRLPIIGASGVRQK